VGKAFSRLQPRCPGRTGWCIRTYGETSDACDHRLPSRLFNGSFRHGVYLSGWMRAWVISLH
jgi:hypothetical protein